MIFKFINAILVAATVLCLGATQADLGQQESWQKIAPVGESFTLLMPTQAVEASRRIPLNDQDSVRERVYYSVAEGKRYMVVSFMKTTPDRAAALSSFDNFMLGIEQSFKVNEKEISKSLAFDRDVPFEGGTCKQYHIKLGEYSGIARFVGTDNAFYALMVIGSDKNGAQVQRFLSSFALGAANTNAELSGVILDTPANAAALERVRAALPPEPWPNTAGPIIGGVLNGKAFSLPVPEYPKAARKKGDSGAVTVKVLIDERGNVIWAEASEGPSTLREAAVAAAWKSRFTPTRLMGQPVKVRGVIIYNFVR
jgi:TonB family protein